MNTRRQDPENRHFRADAFSSSVEFERGVLGNLVAARCHKITDSEEIAMLWWLQQVSWREGGLEAFAERFLAANQARIGTRSMHKYGMEAGQVYSADQIRRIRKEMHGDGDIGLLLARRAGDLLPLDGDQTGEDLMWLLGESKYRSAPGRHPQNYPLAKVKEVCVWSADAFSQWLKSALVDPASASLRMGRWNFPSLWDALCAWRQTEIDAAKGRIVETAVTRQVFEELDFALESRSFVLVEGREGIGKSEAARAWCDQHPGEAVYVRLESGIDEATLYRAIARRVGTACSYARKAVEMRARIQDALQSGHIMLVLDESHFLFPRNNRSERTAPKRIDWVRSALVDHGVPVALVSTPQYFARQCERFSKAGWNSLQIQRRLARTTLLPESLDTSDAAAVAQKYFPALPLKEAKRIAGVAVLTLGYLSTIVHLRKRVDFMASRRPGFKEADLVAAAIEEIAVQAGVQLPAPKKPSATPVQARCTRPADPLSGHATVPRNRLIQHRAPVPV